MTDKAGFVCSAVALLISFASVGALGQTSIKNTGGINGSNGSNTIITAVPFLTITPDARSAGMGDAGVAISPDANGAFWNAGKTCFIEKKMGVSLSYTPWLKSLGTNDIYLFNGGGYYKFTKEDAVILNMTYFNLGSIAFTDINGGKILDFNPQEISLTAGYSRQLSEYLGLGVNARYIHSNLSGSITNSSSSGLGSTGRPANSAAVDIGAFYTRDVAISGTPGTVAFGANLSNFGPKVSYSDNNRRDFIPTNLRIGGAYTTEIDQFNKFTFTVDVNKLLVPTPGSIDTSAGIVGGMISALYQAPGGTKEKLQEIIIATGVEYWYDNILAVRGGYFHESPNKGNRRYFTAGVGARYQQFGMDFAYLIPVQVNNPLSDTMRFTVHFDFDTNTKEASVKD